MIINEIALNNRNVYYSQTFVLFELLKCMKNREVVFLDRDEDYKAIRGMWIKSLNYLKYSFFEMCHFYNANKNYNIYISCAKYSVIPEFSFNFTERSKETQEWFKNTAMSKIYAYDLLLDFDYDNKYSVVEYTKELRDFFLLLQFEKVKFYTIPSGKNFQFVIPSEIWGYDGLNKETRKSDKAVKLINEIKTKFKLKFLDTIGIGTYNKIMKCPYSLSNGIVCLPVENCYFDNFDMFKVDVVLKHIPLKNRGIYFQNDCYTNLEFNKFCEKYKIEV